MQQKKETKFWWNLHVDLSTASCVVLRFPEAVKRSDAPGLDAQAGWWQIACIQKIEEVTEVHLRATLYSSAYSWSQHTN